MIFFEWDENKNKINIKKHGFDFNDARYVFADKDAFTFEDNRKNYGEKREITVGMYKGILLASVCHTDRNGITRIISFRYASKKEKELYYARKNS